MKCPVCRNHKQVSTDFHSDGFKEGITECRICGAAWSVNHGVTEIVRDPQVDSFLQAQSECVEGDDYSLNPDGDKS
uniref:AXH domain-containing protein n=1 Tax=Geobacter sp. (strain M21) TaxID=443144 RepID=C6E2Y8_GEOSM